MDQGRRQLSTLGVTLPANLLGAVLTFGDFRYIDPAAFARRPEIGQLLYSIVFFGALVGVGY